MCGLFLCEIIKGFRHYAKILIFLNCFGIYYDPADYNKVIYRQMKEDYSQRFQTILLDADCLLQKCNGGYDDVSEYQLLVRVFSEQVIKENNTLRLKNKEDGT